MGTRTKFLSATALAALMLASAARAADDPAPQTAPRPDAAGREAAATAVDEVVVTASRSPRRPDQVGQSVTVLDEAAIDASQAVSVVELLARTPGVSFARNGGIGTATSIRIRGAESDQTVLVVDGVRLNDPSGTGGGPNFANLLVGDASRIEVLRGAQSTLWGSQALGGVVNIVTAEPTEPFEATLDAEAGSRETYSVRAGIGGASERLTWRVAGSRFETGGFSAFVRGTEDDGYENRGLSARSTLRLSDAVSLDLRTVYSDGEVEIDGFPPPSFAFGDTREVGTTEELVGYAGLNVDLLDGRFRSRVGYAYTRTDRGSFNPDQAVTPVTFDAQGEVRRLEYQGAFALTDTVLATFGAETEESEFSTRSPSAFTPSPPVSRAETGIDGLYAQLEAEVVDGLTLTGGVRRTEHDTFGGATLGQAAAAWSLNDGDTVLRASFGQGFKAPSLFQLYSDFGNLALEPETADTVDAGIEQRLFDRRVSVSATVFARETEQQIEFVSCTASSVEPLCIRGGVRRSGFYRNLAMTEARGVELAGGTDFGRVRLAANYTLTDTENRTPGGNLGRRLARRPEQQANASATYLFPFGLSTTAEVRYTGDSFDNAANSFRLKSYILVDLRASYPLSEAVELYGRVENVADEAYQTIRNYGTGGRAAFAGVRTRF